MRQFILISLVLLLASCGNNENRPWWKSCTEIPSQTLINHGYMTDNWEALRSEAVPFPSRETYMSSQNAHAVFWVSYGNHGFVASVMEVPEEKPKTFFLRLDFFKGDSLYTAQPDLFLNLPQWGHSIGHGNHIRYTGPDQEIGETAIGEISATVQDTGFHFDYSKAVIPDEPAIDPNEEGI